MSQPETDEMLRGERPRGPRGNPDPHATTMTVDLEDLGYDVPYHRREVAVDVDRRDERVVVRGAQYRYVIDSDGARRVPFDEDRWESDELHTLPEWLQGVIDYVNAGGLIR